MQDVVVGEQIRELVAARHEKGQSVCLELGCGSRKRDETAIGIDVLALPTVDLVGDAVTVLEHFATGSVDRISSSHFLEHVSDLSAVLRACARIMKSGAEFHAAVPHFSNPYFYSDPTHVQPFGLYTFNYLVESSFTKRTVPQYQDPFPFTYAAALYVFKSTRPHYLRHAAKQWARLFNKSTWTKEWYEENWVWRLPAYEIQYQLIRN